MYSKELTERQKEALKHRKELLGTEPYLTIKLDYTTVLRKKRKCSRSKWKVEKTFRYSTFLWVTKLTVYVFLLDITPQK